MVRDPLEIDLKGSFLLIFGCRILDCLILFVSGFSSPLWILNLKSFVDSFFCGLAFLCWSGDLDLFDVGDDSSFELCLCVSLDVVVELDVLDVEDVEDVEDDDDDDDEDDDDDDEDELRVVFLFLIFFWSWRHPKSSAKVM